MDKKEIIKILQKQGMPKAIAKMAAMSVPKDITKEQFEDSISKIKDMANNFKND